MPRKFQKEDRKRAMQLLDCDFQENIPYIVLAKIILDRDDVIVHNEKLKSEITTNKERAAQFISAWTLRNNLRYG